MYLYVLQLFEVDYREGTNFDKILEQEFPLFTGLFRGPEDRARFSHLVFGMVDGLEVLEALVDVLNQAGVSNKKEEIYRLLVLEGRRLG